MTKTAKAKNTLIESDSYEGAYGMWFTRAIIQHHEHGRIMLSECFGGIDSVYGGAYRWMHGIAHNLAETDTLESLREWNSNGWQGFDLLDNLNWSGKIVEKVAQSVGL